MRQGVLALALTTVVALAVPGASFGSGTYTWSGTWSNSNFGDLTLTQTGSTVDGNYPYDAGHLTGTVVGSVLSGAWDEAPTRSGPVDAGPFEFTMSADGKSFTGKWRHNQDTGWYGDWNGTCSAGGCLRNGMALTSPSVAPRVGQLTSYAAPKPMKPLALKLPKLGASVGKATGTVSLVNPGGLKIDDPDFTLGVKPSTKNAIAASKLCAIFMLNSNLASKDPFITFARCSTVVAKILQRAEELRKQRGGQASAAVTPGCRAVTVSPRRRRGRSPISTACSQTATGMRLTIRSRKKGVSLRSVLGTNAQLIVGRGRSVPTGAGDRVDVLWTTGAR